MAELQKRKKLAKYYSRSNDPNTIAVQNIFRKLTKSSLRTKVNCNFDSYFHCYFEY